MLPLKRRLVAEFIGTFALVFAGTGAIIVNDVSGGAITQVGIALTFGLAVMAMIYSVGPVSGAHFNPAVSFGFWIAQRFPSYDLVAYALVQLGAGFVASLLLRYLFPLHPTLGATSPVGSIGRSITLEVVATFFLVFVILCVATGAKEQGTMAGAAIGVTVTLCALFAGPISGASMNPARSFGPALVTNNLGGLWIYLLGPFLGAALASKVVPLMRPVVTPR